MQRIDAHLHLWHFQEQEYGWLEGDLAPLRRDFLPGECQRELASAGVSGAIAVQARQSVEETDWLLSLADAHPALLGVVGWLPLRQPNFATQLAPYLDSRALKGLRHVVQGEHAGFMDDLAFNRGLATLASTGLTYDVLIFAPQLPEATRLVDRHPRLSFVLDHVAKPRIRAGEIETWSREIRALAQRPNVVCKVSGMVTEADPHAWTSEQLRPYFDTVLEAFTPERLMVGTDWPVLTAGCTYSQWWHMVEHWAAALSAEERAALLGNTARRIYSITPPAESASPNQMHETRLS